MLVVAREKPCGRPTALMAQALGTDCSTHKYPRNATTNFTFLGPRMFWRKRYACFWVLDMNPEFLLKNEYGEWVHNKSYYEDVRRFLGSGVSWATCDRRRREYVRLGGVWR